MSVQNSQKQGGLFGIPPPALAYSIIELFYRIGDCSKANQEGSAKDHSGSETTFQTLPIPDDGMRMQAVMDSVVSRIHGKGGVSAEEIAAAFAQSMPPSPTPPAPTKIPVVKATCYIPAEGHQFRHH